MSVIKEEAMVKLLNVLLIAVGGLMLIGVINLVASVTTVGVVCLILAGITFLAWIFFGPVYIMIEIAEFEDKSPGEN